jgi:hypothetical protein
MMKVLTSAEASMLKAEPIGNIWLMQVPSVGRGAGSKMALRGAVLAVARGWHGCEVEIIETARGPELRGAPWHVSFSYDGYDGWVAWSRRGRIGVDAERIRAIPEARELTEQYLSGTATDDLMDLDASIQFTRRWTEMEASHKARGGMLGEKHPKANVPLTICHHQHRDVIVTVAQ